MNFRPITIDDLSEETMAALAEMNVRYAQKSMDSSIQTDKFLAAIETYLKNANVGRAGFKKRCVMVEKDLR